MLKQRPSQVLRAHAVALLLLFVIVNGQVDNRPVCNASVAASSECDVRHSPEQLSATTRGFSTNEASPAKNKANASSKARRSAYAVSPFTGNNVDKILDVELGPTSIVITTTKQGPVNSLKVHIQLTDLHDNRTLPPIDLFGIFLIVARGRYTVPFLKPERWYGLKFTSENNIDGEINVHTENRLIRTTNRKNEAITVEDLYEVRMHRDLDGEESAEKLYVTAAWKDKERRVPHGELHVTVEIRCASSTTTEHMILLPDEDAVTIEVSMDLLYDIEQINGTLQQVIAHITPLKCKEICWQTSLEASIGEEFYTAESPVECHQVEGTSTESFLRRLKEHYVEKGISGYELVVETEQQDEQEEGHITLTAQNLAKDEGKPRTKTFSIKESNGIFRLPLLPDSVYAVKYQYTKEFPFHFTNKEHFLAETGSTNSSEPSQPLIETHFKIENQTMGKEEVTFVPVVTLSQGGSYSDREVHLGMEPLCDELNSPVWDFGGNETSTKIDLTAVICSHHPEALFCNETITYPECSPLLCYSTAVFIGGINYPSESRCVNITEQFSEFPTHNNPAYLRHSLFLLIALYFLYLY